MNTRGCHTHIAKLWGDLRPPEVKVLTKNFYCSFESGWSSCELTVLSLKFCLTLDRFCSKHQRNVVALPLTFENIDRWLSVWPRSQIMTIDSIERRRRVSMSRPTVYMCATPPCEHSQLARPLLSMILTLTIFKAAVIKYIIRIVIFIQTQ